MKAVNATLLRRLGAMLYDGLLVTAVLMLATVPFVIERGGETVEPDDNYLYQLSMLIVMYLFFVYFWTRGGQTLGMRAWRLRLETDDGRSPSITVASLRFFVAIVSLIPFGLGFLWQLWDKDRLTWHDRIAGTRMLHYPKP
jgi:uncharacterized RDD family membrane protein YckC